MVFRLLWFCIVPYEPYGHMLIQHSITILHRVKPPLYSANCVNSVMEQDLYIVDRNGKYILFDHNRILLITKQKGLCYRYMCDLQGVPYPDQYKKIDLYQDISVDKPLK